jgi:Cu-processing system permease protein
MRTMARIARFECRDVVRSRWLVGYALFFLALSDILLRFSDSTVKAALSLSNVVLFIVPLVSLVFGTMYLYNAREFTELLLTQPVGRRQMFGGLYLGLALPLAAAFLAGVGAPLVFHGMDDTVGIASLATLAAAGVGLTWAFLALGLLISVRVNDRVRGLGVAIAIWLLAAVVYDGGVLLAASLFADYPLEKPMLGLMLSNPVDLARVALLLHFDAGVLMGYTGAVFERFFGSAVGTAAAGLALAAWIAAPLTLGMFGFRRKDF